MAMSDQTRRRIEAAMEASRLVKTLPEWMFTGLRLTAEERRTGKDEEGQEP